MMPKSGLNKRYVRDFCALKNYSALNGLIQRSWLRELDGIITMHTLIKETIQITCKPTLKSCMPFIERMINELSALRCYNDTYEVKMMIYGIASHLYELYPEIDLETCSFYGWAELVFSHCDQSLKSLALATSLYCFYKSCLGEEHFKTARMLCRMGCDEQSYNHSDKALELLLRGRCLIKQIHDKSNQELIYLSDVDSQISGLLILFYDISHDGSLLDKAYDVAVELIDIRTKSEPFIISPYKNCVGGYLTLAKIAIRRNQIQEANQYLLKAEDICQKSRDGVKAYAIDFTKVELAIAQEDWMEAINIIENAFKQRELYFGRGPAGDSKSNYIKMKIKLGQLYVKIGNSSRALEIYRDVLESIRPLLFYESECRRIESYIRELEQ